MTLIPSPVTSQWRKAIRQSDALKAKVLCEVRDFIFENKDKYPVGQLQKEAAEALMVPTATLRDWLGTIREYPEITLNALIVEGMSFSHIDIANQCRPENPLSLLNEAIELGGKNGGTMTADELLEFALGEKPSRSPIYGFNRWWDGRKKAINGLPPEKQEAARGLFDEFEPKFRKLFEKG